MDAAKEVMQAQRSECWWAKRTANWSALTKATDLVTQKAGASGAWSDILRVAASEGRSVAKSARKPVWTSGPAMDIELAWPWDSARTSCRSGARKHRSSKKYPDSGP